LPITRIYSRSIVRDWLLAPLETEDVVKSHCRHWVVWKGEFDYYEYDHLG